MKAAILRAASLPVDSPILPVSPKLTIRRRDSFSGEKSAIGSPKISMQYDSTSRKREAPIRRAISESNLIGSKNFTGSWTFPTKIPEDDDSWTESGETIGFFGDGYGNRNGKKYGGGGGGYDENEMFKLGEHYKQMLKSNPGDSLLLRNYGKFLHEVEGDMERAEEYYGRAILANPGDGEVLSLYGKLIWDSQRDEQRATSYFDQALSASPDDCMILGSYAQFMWENEEEEEISCKTGEVAAMVAAVC